MKGDDTKVLLVGGSSHTGKSTLARALATALGWNLLSTDQLARHPGRPWRGDDADVPEDVVSHYATLAPAQLLDDVTRHYTQNVWPIAAAIVGSHVNNPFDPGLVLEGSAILPECVAATPLTRTRSVWLTVPDALLRRRILASSDFDRRPARQQRLIDAFINRSVDFQQALRGSLGQLGLEPDDATDPTLPERLLSACRSAGG